MKQLMSLTNYSKSFKVYETNRSLIMKKEYVFAFKGVTPKERFLEFAGPEGLLDDIANEALFLKKKDETALIHFPIGIWFQYGKLMKAVYALVCNEDKNLGTHFDTFIALAKTKGDFKLRDSLIELRREIILGCKLHKDLEELGVENEEASALNQRQRKELENKYDYVYMRNRVRSLNSFVDKIIGSMVV